MDDASPSVPPEPLVSTPPEPSAGTPPEPSAGTPPEPSAGTPPEPSAGTPPGSARPAVRRRGVRDRHGRGMRGPLMPATVELEGRRVRVPAAQTRGQRFDELVLSAVERLEEHWSVELRGVEFAVEDVPPDVDAGPTADDDVVADQSAGGSVPLGRLFPVAEAGGAARVTVYRRPLEVRAADRSDLADLVHDVVVEQVARLLGRTPEEIDPQRD